MGMNERLELMAFDQVMENRERRHKTGRLVRASTTQGFWGATWKVTSRIKNQNAILFLEVISLTNNKEITAAQDNIVNGLYIIWEILRRNREAVLPLWLLLNHCVQFCCQHFKDIHKWVQERTISMTTRLKNITPNIRFIEVNLFSLSNRRLKCHWVTIYGPLYGGEEFIVRILLKGITKSNWKKRGDKYIQVRKKAQIYNGEDN